MPTGTGPVRARDAEAPARPSVVVVGSYVQDRVFRCEDFPRTGETVLGCSSTAHGGKGSNQAIAAARAGARVAFIGGIGEDEAGAAARAFHAAEGIECRAIVKAGASTGTAGIIVNARGDNQIVVALNANEALTAADVAKHADCISGAHVLIVQLETGQEATVHAMRLARAAGRTVILNPAPMRGDLDPAVIALAHIVVPNEGEFCRLARQLAGAHAMPAGLDEQALSTLSAAELHALCRRLGVETLIVTLGSRGAFVSSPSGYLSVPATPGIIPVDTTGAGDAFVGSLACALAEYDLAALERAVRFANTAAGISVGRIGAAASMPLRAEIDRCCVRP